MYRTQGDFFLIELHSTPNAPPTPPESQKECRYTPHGTAYMGTRSHTNTYKACQRWDSQFPHAHGYYTDEDFPDLTMTEAENYCRNPDDQETGGPWCYTMDPTVRWEYCDIPFCGKIYNVCLRHLDSITVCTCVNLFYMYIISPLYRGSIETFYQKKC